MRLDFLSESKERFIERLPAIWDMNNPDGTWEVPGKNSVFIVTPEIEEDVVTGATEILRRFPNWEKEIDWNSINSMPPYEWVAKIREWRERIKRNEARNAGRKERKSNPVSMFSDREMFNCLGMYKGWVAVQPLNHEAAVKLADVSVGGLPGQWCICHSTEDHDWEEHCSDGDRFLLLWNPSKKPGVDHLVKCMVQYKGFWNNGDWEPYKDTLPIIWTEFDHDIDTYYQDEDFYYGWVEENLNPLTVKDLIGFSDRLEEQSFVGDSDEDMEDDEDMDEEMDESADGLKKYSNLDFLYSVLTESKEHIIKKLPRLSDWEKDCWVRFSKEHPEYDNRVDWNRPDSITWDDFEKIHDEWLAKQRQKERIDPDTVPEFSDKRDEGDGITTYQVQDDKAGREAVRKVISSHYDHTRNPWCLARNNSLNNYVGMGGTDSDRYWGKYDAYPKRIGFRNGRLMGFMAADATDPHFFDKEAAMKDPGIKAEYEDYVAQEREYETPEDEIKTFEEWIGERLYSGWEDFQGDFDEEYGKYYDDAKSKRNEVPKPFHAWADETPHVRAQYGRVFRKPMFDLWWDMQDKPHEGLDWLRQERLGESVEDKSVLEEMYLKDAIVTDHAKYDRFGRMEKLKSLPEGEYICHRVGKDKNDDTVVYVLLSNGVIEIYGVHYRMSRKGNLVPYPVFITAYAASPAQLGRIMDKSFYGLPYEVQGRMDEIALANKAKGLCDNKGEASLPRPPKNKKPRGKPIGRAGFGNSALRDGLGGIR